MDPKPPSPYLAFDIEIATIIPDSARNWNAYRPYGVSCAATLTSGGQLTIWHGKTPGGGLADLMSMDELVTLVEFLEDASQNGLKILTWNGLGFDFDVLAEESGLPSECKALALEHIDMMFHFFCRQGYALGLDQAARGMGLPGKPPGMSGEMAPKYWKAGRRQEVLAYVAQDVRTTLDLATRVDQQGRLQWNSKTGRLQEVLFDQGWLTVREALRLPEPDTSWMRDPWRRSKFTSWLERIP